MTKQEIIETMISDKKIVRLEKELAEERAKKKPFCQNCGNGVCPFCAHLKNL